MLWRPGQPCCAASWVVQRMHSAARKNHCAEMPLAPLINMEVSHAACAQALPGSSIGLACAEMLLVGDSDGGLVCAARAQALPGSHAGPAASRRMDGGGPHRLPPDHQVRAPSTMVQGISPFSKHGRAIKVQCLLSLTRWI